MTTWTRTASRWFIALVALLTIGSMPATASAAFDGSRPLLCAITTVMECDGTGQCHRYTQAQHPDFPAFLRVNVAERLITADDTPRKTEIKSTSHLDGRLILHGGENGRGWAATIAEDTGRMSAGVVADSYTFALFGACTHP